MKKGAILVNTARGALVDEDAMLAALRSGHIRHAGLDVFHNEPLKSDHPLTRMENVTLSAHSAFRTREASETLLRRAIDIVKASLSRGNFPRLFALSRVGGRHMAESKTLSPVAAHGAARLPSVEIDSYNVELKDDEGFLGDRASKGAFNDIVDNWRKALRKAGDDPFGDTPTEDLSKKQLDELLAKGDPEAAGVIHGAIEDFAQELALVIRRFLKLKAGQVLSGS